MSADSRIRIERALTDAQRRDVFAFRYDVYVNEMGKRGHIVDESAEPLLLDELDETACIYGAWCGDDLVGTVRGNFAEDFTAESPMPSWVRDIYGLDPFIGQRGASVVVTSRLMIAQNRRGSMALGALLRHTYEFVADRDTEFMFCNCAPSLIGMYERLGFRRYAHNVMDAQVGYRVPMVLAVFDREHLERVRSPFLRSLRHRTGLDSSSVDWFDRTFGDAVAHHSTAEFTDDDFWDQFFTRIGTDLENSIQALQGLSQEQLMHLAKSGVVLRCARGDELLREQDTGSEMFVIVSGRVRVRHADDVVVELGPGEVFGEIAMLTGTPRTAAVTAIEDCELFVFTRAQLDRIMTRAPDLASRLLLNLAHILAQRLTDTTHQRTSILRRTA